MMHHSLLDDSIISMRNAAGEVKEHPLPQVLDALNRADVLSFEALQPHQQQPWYSFLVQLAAMGVAREAGGETPSGAAEWREVLLGLSDGSEAAWHLVVEDVAQPAFMQPPVPEGSLKEAKYKADVPTPDQLDILITSKNHDVKASRINHPRPEHWLFALCTLQTMEGFLGRGNYGIVRMNGGFGNRPMVGLADSLSWGRRFRRDVDVLLAARGEFSERYDLGGHALLWLERWDGAKNSGIPLEDCDPYFIEICRRIRFTLDGEQIVCWRTNTKGQRVAAPDALNGATGDPWTPVEKKGAKALTVGESGFTYRLLQEIFLSEEYARPFALEFQESERHGAYLIARTLVRGQGKTDGLHNRVVPVKAKAAAWLTGDSSRRALLAKRAEQRVKLAADVQRSVLYPAIATLLSSGRDGKVDWDRVHPWTDAFDRAVDARFFEALWDSVEMDQEEARRHWETILWEEAQRQYDDAERSTPMAAVHQWRARSKARSILRSRAHQVFDQLFEPASSKEQAEVMQ